MRISDGHTVSLWASFSTVTMLDRPSARSFELSGRHLTTTCGCCPVFSSRGGTALQSGHLPQHLCKRDTEQGQARHEMVGVHVDAFYRLYIRLACHRLLLALAAYLMAHSVQAQAPCLTVRHDSRPH